MTNTITLQAIQREKVNQLLRDHKSLLTRYLKNKKDLSFKVREQILKYYNTQITKDNIEQQYNKKLGKFLYDLLT